MGMWKNVRRISFSLREFHGQSLVGFINSIILATEPYSNTNNIIPKINQNLSAHYCSNGTSKPRAAILIHKNP